jgi:hypothetical protein
MNDAPDPEEQPLPAAAVQRSIDLMTIYEGLPENERARAAERIIALSDEAQKNRRERVRRTLAYLLFGAIVAEALIAFYVAEVAKSASWDEVKDWLTLSLVPLTTAAGIAASFLYPSKETE